MNLLIVNGDLPIFPGRAGHEYLHTTGLSRLAHRVGVVSMVHTAEEDDKAHALRAAGVDLYLCRDADLGAGGARPRSRLRRGAALLYQIARNWRRHPLEIALQDRRFRNLAAPLVEAFGTGGWQGLIVVQSICARWLDYMPRLPVSVLVMHDVRALVYERRAAAAATLRERLALRRASRRYRRFEREYCDRYDLVVTVSPADEAWVRTHYRPRRLTTIPIPVDADYFAPMPAIPERPARILFTGMLSHPPNEDAACYFARTVFPLIRARLPHAEFWVVGREPTAAVGALSTLPGVVVTGAVPDIRLHIAEATVVVVPIRFGSGVRNKILESWAMQKCIVSTTIGAEGLACEDGVNILLADGAPAFAARVVDAISDPALRERIRVPGRSLVETSHDPQTLARRYHEVIGGLLGEASRPERALRVAVDLRADPRTPPETSPGPLLDHLAALDGDTRYAVLTSSHTGDDLPRRAHRSMAALLDSAGSRWRAATIATVRALHRSLGAEYWRTPDVERLRRARALDADVVLSMSGVIHPDVAPLTNVLVVSDIAHECCPEFFARQDVEERRRLYSASARRATHICAVSEFTRQTLIERLGIPPERITTTPLAADPLFHPDSRARRNVAGVLQQHGLTAGAYLLFAGGSQPYRNHEAGFQALRVLREAYGLEPMLAYAGGSSAGHDDLRGKIHDAGLTERVRFLGPCAPADMPALYEGSAGLLFPSLVEGFGMPLLEAMWCDCPVVCSNTASLPEIAGAAALLVDPRSPEDLAHALYRILTDRELRALLIERGRQRAREFSWMRFSRDLLSVVHRVGRARYTGSAGSTPSSTSDRR